MHGFLLVIRHITAQAYINKCDKIMTTPAVSVIIPCFNLGQYLEEAVDSVFAQTFEDFEIFIVDDGSTDKATRELLATYKRPRTCVLRTENRGLSAARNTGTANTTGKYICMLDADDRLDSQYMQMSVAVLDADPSIAFVSHWCRVFGDEAYDWKPDRCDFPTLLDVNTVNGAALVRRSALEAVGGFDESMRTGCEDWDLWITMVARGFNGRILPEILYYYRRRAGSMSHTMMQHDGHSRLYRFLVEKHANSYRAHLPALLYRRARDTATLQRHITDLTVEYHDLIGPELAKHRDDLTMAERRVSRHTCAREIEEERFRLRAELDLAMRSVAVASDEANAQREAANRARMEMDCARNEADGLRRSLSWRAMAPFRAVLDGIYRLTGNRHV
jgi:glycosyltransferase involved in cell wall biosynthesis